MKNHLPRYKEWIDEKRILLYSTILLVLTAGIILTYFIISKRFRATQQWVSHTQSVLNQIDSIRLRQTEFVLDTRTYLITGDSAFLSGSDSSINYLITKIDHLKNITKDNPLQLERLGRVSGILNNYLVIRDKTVELRRRENFSLENEVPHVLAAHQMSALFSKVFREIKLEEQRLLRERRQVYRSNVVTAATVFLILLLLFVLSIIIAIVVIYRSTKKRRRAEAELIKSNQLVQGLVQHSPLLINVKDTAGRFIMVNRMFAGVLGSTPEEMIGKRNSDFLPGETTDPIKSGEEEVLKTGRSTELIVKLPGSDGGHTYITSKFPLFDATGEMYAVGSTSVDVTPLKQAHDAIQKSYEQQQKLLDGLQKVLSASSDVLCVLNIHGNFTQVSESCENLLGYKPKEMMSKNYREFVRKEDVPKTEVIMRQIISGVLVPDFVTRFKRKNDGFLPVVWTAQWSAEDQMVYAIARDATQIIKTEKRLAQTEARLINAQKIARLGSWDWDLENNEWSCSDEIYDLLGIQKKPDTHFQQFLFDAVYKEDRQLMEQVIAEALQKGTSVEVEHRIVRPDQTVLHVHTKGEITRNSGGKAIWFSGTMQDITERKTAELQLQQLNENLTKQAAELKASNAELERFAYVASHDLQEPLRMVSSFLTLLQKKLENSLDETAQKYIHFAVDGADRMKRLIQDLLQFSKLGSSQEAFTQVDLNEVVQDAVELYQTVLNENGATIKTANLPVVKGNKVQLGQLFQNLLGNALKYRSVADPVIEIGCSEEKDRWQFLVKDNGIGIDPKFFDKIFIIFQRLHTKGEYSGTGIGLAICKKIVERHGGNIWVESAPDRGSGFYFTLLK